MNNKDRGHVMIVDDEDIVRFLLCDMMKNFGYSVTDFSDPIKAIDFYEKNHSSIDLVLLDMTMPNLSGRETFFLLKKINRNIKSIVLSGFSLNEDIEKMLMEGCLFHLKKPVKIMELKNAVNNILIPDQADSYISCELESIRNNLLISEADVDGALKNMGGNVDLYLKMLDKFIINYKNAASKIKELATEANYEDLFVFSHSIKSVAASLGFLKLQAVSEKIENACHKKEASVIEENIGIFYDEMLSLSSKIAFFINERTEKQNFGAIPEDSQNETDCKLVLTHLDELIKYAKRSRPKQTTDLFNDKLKNISCSEFGYLDKEELLKKIRRYDFEGVVNYAEIIKTRFKDRSNEQKL